MKKRLLECKSLLKRSVNPALRGFCVFLKSGLIVSPLVGQAYASPTYIASIRLRVSINQTVHIKYPSRQNRGFVYKTGIWSLIYVRGIRITMKVVAFLVKKLESWKVRRLKGYTRSGKQTGPPGVGEERQREANELENGGAPGATE